MAAREQGFKPRALRVCKPNMIIGGADFNRPKTQHQKPTIFSEFQSTPLEEQDKQDTEIEK